MAKRKRLTTDQVITALLREMFRRVGEDYDVWVDTICKEDNEWYMRKSWTEEQEAEFRKWVVAFLREQLRLPKYRAEREMQWFCLQWAWTNVLRETGHV